MKLATAPASLRRASRNENANYPQREPPAAEPLTKAALLSRLTEANGSPQSPASPAPEITAAAVHGMSPQQALDAVHGVPLNHALRHRGGGQ